MPAGRHRAQVEVRRSVFIATLEPVATVDEARALIAARRAEFPTATHVVYAFVVGHGASVVQGMSDDGEPSGTAGPPTLAVLEGSGLGDACLTTARFFGGTKLGTGGLVRAYADAARAVLADAPTEAHRVWAHGSIDCPYERYEAVRRLLEERGAVIDDADFAATVRLTLRVPDAAWPGVAEAVANLTGGRARLNPRAME